MIYSLGSGVTTDHAKALAWLQKAAEHGQALAQLRLGFVYWMVTGCRKAAVKAAEQGNAEA